MDSGEGLICKFETKTYQLLNKARYIRLGLSFWILSYSGFGARRIRISVVQLISFHCLHWVSSNICGPIETTSIEGYWYFITFTNDFSCYMHVRLCKSKDDALNIFKMWKACAEKEMGQTLKILCTDSGGKYTSNAFSTYLAEHGIKCELTNVYTPQENGVSEWANQTLNNLACSMIADMKEALQAKSLPSSLWSQAVHHVAWIKNRVFTHSLNSDITPYQAYFGKKPSLATLQLFGCKAYAHTPKIDQSKFGECTIKCIHIGFAEEKKGVPIIQS